MKVFIASSKEALPSAKTVAAWLEENKLNPIIWNDPDVFHVGEFNYQSLLRISTEVQAAVILMTDDDKVWYRDKEKTQPRDNVLIEFGLFSSRLGLSKAIIITKGAKVMSSISDLAGIVCIDMGNPRNAQNQLNKWSERLLTDENRQIIEVIIDHTPCQADWQISQRSAKTIGIDIDSKDASNLFFVLLGVRSCEQSRTIILDLEAESADGIVIEALYDLMGAWDLLIKFRAKSDTIAKNFFDLIFKALKAKVQMVESETESFGKKQLINVLTQSKTVNNLINLKDGELITYTLLPNNSDYDNFRASRSFVFIEAKGSKGSKQRIAFLRNLNNAITRGTGKTIIESVCEGENELIIETLSTCSQSTLINHLNREIEQVLNTYNLQKYTLSCYYYDETGLLNNAKGVEEF